LLVVIFSVVWEFSGFRVTILFQQRPLHPRATRFFSAQTTGVVMTLKKTSRMTGFHWI